MYSSTASKTTNESEGRSDLVAKLLARALDPACLEGEANNAAAKMVTIARRESVTLPDLLNHLAIVRIETIPTPVEPVECEIEFPYGKHAGQSLRTVARVNPGYLKWCVENFSDCDLQQACGVVYGWLKNGGGK